MTTRSQRNGKVLFPNLLIKACVVAESLLVSKMLMQAKQGRSFPFYWRSVMLMVMLVGVDDITSCREALLKIIH